MFHETAIYGSFSYILANLNLLHSKLLDVLYIVVTVAKTLLQ